jgi:ubiquinone/menaquinone biosynthesis C-methylase UbiE
MELLDALKAAGEPTRLRILAVLDASELTVSELCRVLNQSQPRVSRHLRLLCDAGLLERHAEGTSAFFRPLRHGTGHQLFQAMLPLLDLTDPALERDRARLASIRIERANAAAHYFESVASRWDKPRDLNVTDEEVERALLDAVGDRPLGNLLDIGTGTGRILELFAGRIRSGLGIDLSREMLNVARSRLDQQRLTNCSVRQGNVYDLDVDDDSIDVAVLHHVLHFLDDPAAAIEQAARTLRPDGVLLIVDFAPHTREQLRVEFAHRRLGFTDDQIAAWCARAKLADVTSRSLTHTPPNDEEPLTVTLWTARPRHGSHADYELEAAAS